MATVYLAQDLKHPRQVAIKVRSEVVGALGADRFLKEIEVISRLELLSELDARGRERYVPAYDRAVINAGLNQIDSALVWLQRAYEERSSWMSYLSV